MAFGRPRLTDPIRRSIGFTALLVLIFVVPYLLSAMNLPHLSGAVRLVSGLTSDPTPVWERAFNSVMGLGLLGDSNPAVNIPGRPFTDPISALIIGLGRSSRCAICAAACASRCWQSGCSCLGRW